MIAHECRLGYAPGVACSSPFQAEMMCIFLCFEVVAMNLLLDTQQHLFLFFAKVAGETSGLYLEIQQPDIIFHASNLESVVA